MTHSASSSDKNINLRIARQTRCLRVEKMKAQIIIHETARADSLARTKHSPSLNVQCYSFSWKRMNSPMDLKLAKLLLQFSQKQSKVVIAIKILALL